jgi:hypothetical protein
MMLWWKLERSLPRFRLARLGGDFASCSQQNGLELDSVVAWAQPVERRD